MYLSSSYTKPDVVVTSKEVEANNGATLSCVVTGLTHVLDTVMWKKDDVNITTLTDYASNYVEVDGILNGNSQTTTLQIIDVGNTDTGYKCSVTSDEHSETHYETTVDMDVFSEFFFFGLGYPVDCYIWFRSNFWNVEIAWDILTSYCIDQSN